MVVRKDAEKGDSKRNPPTQQAEVALSPLKEGDTIMLPDRQGGMPRWTIVVVGSGKR